MQKGNIGVTTENIFPVIKKFLYSDHEIFLREIVSNAIDATQKLKTLQLKGDFSGDLGDLTVRVNLDKEAGTITVSDRGIGLTADEIDRYINQMQWQLLHDFEGAIRHMTISQGQLLVRLGDREIGKTSYNIVKDYKSGIAAGFWQGIAKLFGQNLKNHYDPDGVDKQTEELVRAWERGEFEELYFSVFFEWPKKTELPSEYR